VSFSLVSQMHSAACLLNPSSCPGRTVMCAPSSSAPHAGTRDLAVAPCGGRGGGDDPEDRVLTGDPLELRQRGVPVHRQVRPGSRGDREVAPQDGRPVTGLHLLQAHLLAAAAAQDRAAAGRADVAHPVRVLAEHRHQVPPALVLSDYHRERHRRPVRRPGTSSVIARAGDNIPAENWAAEIRFAARAMAPGRPVRYIHRFTQYNR